MDKFSKSVDKVLYSESHWTRAEVKKQLSNRGYYIGKTIGEGSYSKVYYSEFRKSGQQFAERRACKIIDRKQCSMQHSHFLPGEIKTMIALNHPNIISVHSVFEFGPFVCIFMDHCHHGDLLQRIQERGKLSESKARLFFHQLVSAVNYMHTNGFCHRDIKCENVLLASPTHVKLSDFTFSKKCSNEVTIEQLSATFCGSVAYAAPEILKGIRYDPKRGDMWSLGCVLFIMLTETMPFDETNILETITRQERKQYFYPEGVKLNPTILDLIDCLIEPDVVARASIGQVVQHPWINKSDPLKVEMSVSGTIQGN
ncbi:testis-specific serine/threonine-protein kinase 3-like [Toxorhynchites rutilus septentrionalis]|uniref:testis-specific serine/threonine-protein kinase 3-like n=1 Tax=Toxorhynchites rutilus septentrionalis TaxID=329112 RepID=UPI0024788AD0|nr:testis-specific serine/threonine-protein kinase 3-like [Toxorhynchites rutilus septentrionalis]